MPPDETTNADVSVAPVFVEPVTAEPTTVAEPKPVAVAEPVIIATPTEPVLEIVAEPSVVTEVQVAPEPVSAVLVPAEPVAETPASVATEPMQAPEQSVETAQPSVSAPVGDLGLTPQSTPNEALKIETTTEFQPMEPVMAVAPSAPEPAKVLARSAPEPMQSSAQPHGFVLALFAKGRVAIQARKRKKLDRIMGLFAKQASITNDDAEKLLHISDATACRYLGILEKEGKVKQVGRAGRWVSYVKAG